MANPGKILAQRGQIHFRPTPMMDSHTMDEASAQPEPAIAARLFPQFPQKGKGALGRTFRALFTALIRIDADNSMMSRLAE
jgi:hypothetical protein